MGELLSGVVDAGFDESLAAGPEGPVRLRWYRAASGLTATELGPTVVWAHGGAFFAGGLDQPEAHDVALALAARGVRVVTVDYRLAPVPGLPRFLAGSARARFPAPMEELVTALRHVGSRSEGRLILGGASAGACLAASAALRTLGTGLELSGVVLAYGFFHSVHPRSVEIRRRVRDHRRVTHSRWVLNAVNRNYAGSDTALADRFAFPGGHDLTGFPSTLMIDADRDVVRASGERFAEELLAAGVEVERHVLPESRHAFLNRQRLKEFTAAVDLMAAWCLSQERPT
ncbi:alpha/beta hydrolase [Paenarthrobacter sp. AB444]|uniref:alpha/beta hydrolase n=1 Tax=Paenarthrobacter sp. AB444 TaxID=3025681 RepID=UPI003FD496D1